MMAYRPSRTFTGFANESRLLCNQLLDGAIETATFLERCARLTNAVIGCSRTGIWIFVPTAAGQILRCLAMYDADADRMTTVPDEKREVQPYFEALETQGFVSASDADLHPATAGLFSPLRESARRPGRARVRSLLAASCAVNGHLFGAFTCSQVGERKEWTPRQLGMLRQIGAPASLALYRASRYTATTGFGPLVT